MNSFLTVIPIAALINQARRQLLTLEFRQYERGSHIGPCSGCGLFPGQRAHGQESSVHGYNLRQECIDPMFSN
jgi:hypothetical protein